MCMDMDIRIDMCLDMCMDMCKDMRIDMCMDMCMDHAHGLGSREAANPPPHPISLHPILAITK